MMDIQMIAVTILILALMIYLIVNQRFRILEWLRYAVSKAEKELGRYTGQLKLRLVYDWYVEKFPVISALLPFSIFSHWVDIALKTMDKWLNAKGAISKWIDVPEEKPSVSQSDSDKANS